MLGLDFTNYVSALLCWLLFLPVESSSKALKELRKKIHFFLFSCFLYSFLLLTAVRVTKRQFFTLMWHFILAAAADFSLHFSQHFQKQPHQTSSERSASPSDSSLDMWVADTGASALQIPYSISEVLIISTFSCPSLRR